MVIGFLILFRVGTAFPMDAVGGRDSAALWNQFKQQQESLGAKFAFSDFVPASVPDDQNFALTPVMICGMKRNPDESRVQWPENKLDMVCFYDDYFPAGKDWSRGAALDLGEWQTYFRRGVGRTNALPVPARIGASAADVLFALQNYSNNIEALRIAAQLPYSRFPLGYDAEYPYAIVLPHLFPLKNCAKTLQLRACAELRLGDSEHAFADIELMFRLADSIRTEPVLISQLVRFSMISAALQPVWEGLSRHQWSDAQLAELGTDLQGFDLLKDYKNALAGSQAIFVTTFDEMGRRGDFTAISNLVQELMSAGMDRAAYGKYLLTMPKDWCWRNELFLATEYQQEILPSVDDGQKRVHAEHLSNLDRDLGQTMNARETGVARAVMPAVLGGTPRGAYTQTMVDLARVAVALERYQLAHWNYPEVLGDLVPDYLAPADIPHEIMTGRPLHYQRTSSWAFKLYATGWAGTYEGAEAAYTPVNDSNHSRGDWVWPVGRGIDSEIRMTKTEPRGLMGDGR
jgi:hypothetical protein